MGSFALDVRCAFRGLLRSRPRTVGILSTLYGSGRLARTVTKRSFQFLTTDRGTNFLRIFGRLRSGGTVAQVRDEWGRIARELREAYPGTNAKKTEPRVLPLKEEMLGTQRPALVLLMGAVLSVWLLACTNILNLQLIRLLAHERESAIRCAIGASAMEVTRPYLIENIALICAGGGLGAAVAASPCGSRCGVYTVVSAAAREQRRQLAIRLALGASPSAMVRAVLALTGGLLGIGVPLGLALAGLALPFVLTDLGVDSNDWSVSVLASAVISVAAVAASYLRARRVLELDPALTLRSE
jgi:ABC-type antimicrobial peptide transport system permease subunit